MSLRLTSSYLGQRQLLPFIEWREEFESRVLPVTRSIGELFDCLPIPPPHTIQFLETERGVPNRPQVLQARRFAERACSSVG